VTCFYGVSFCEWDVYKNRRANGMCFVTSFLYFFFFFFLGLGSGSSDDRHLQLMSVSFRNMFAPINVQSVKIKHCSRVVLFDRNAETNEISVRHYRIVLNPLGISKSIKRVAQKRKVNTN
jgi:hypothetical protein